MSKRNKNKNKHEHHHDLLDFAAFTVSEMFEHGRKYPESDREMQSMAQGIAVLLGVIDISLHDGEPFSLEDAHISGYRLLRRHMKTASDEIVNKELEAMEKQLKE